MIFRSQNLTSPQVDVTIHGVSVDYFRIVQIHLEMSERDHDLVRIVMAGIPPQAITDYINAPVSLSWFQNSMGHNFVGYVTFVEPQYRNSAGTVNGSNFQEAILYCMGASSMMRAKANRVWESATLYDIVKTISAKYQFSFSIPKDTFTYTRLVQSEESDWELLNRVSDFLGYSFTCHGTHLHMFDRYKAVGRGISFHKLDAIGRTTDTQVRPGRVLSLRGSFGQVTPSANSNAESITTLDNRGVLVSAESPEHVSHMGAPIPSTFTDELAVPLLSPEYAQRLLDSRARHKFPFTAKLELTGTAGVTPGGIVDIDRFNSNFDGLWYVSKVCHTITFDKFFTDVDVIKDSTNDETYTIPPVESVGEYPSSTLRLGKWQAETEREEVYG